MVSDREIAAAVDKYIALLEAGDRSGAVAAQVRAEELIAAKEFYYDGVLV